MSGLDRPIDAPVHFSTLIDGAADNSASSRQTSLNTSVSHDSIDEGRMSKLRGCGIDDGYDNNHRRASGEVARLLPVIAAHRTPMAAPRLHLDYAWPDF